MGGRLLNLIWAIQQNFDSKYVLKFKIFQHSAFIQTNNHTWSYVILLDSKSSIVQHPIQSITKV